MEELSSFRRRLEHHFPRLTKSEQKLASFLMTSYDQAAFLNAAEMAAQMEISEATVVRFARSVGYKSFPELKRCLQDIFRDKNSPATRLQRKLADLQTGEGHILTKVVDMELQYLSDVPRSVSQADFDRAVRIILKAEHIFIFGVGPSHILAELVELRLNRFGVAATALTDTGRNLFDKMLLLRHGDVVLATGFNRLTGELVAVIERAHQVGCKVVLLTDTLGAHFKDKVDVVLSARRGPVSSFHSLTVPMAIMNAIILAVAMSRPEESVAYLDQLAELRTSFGLDLPGSSNP
jgi:DNA-binding MurR/RpiR family transcriptional regulator